MKKNTTYLIALGIIALFSSCGESIVNLEPKDKFTTDVALSTLEGLEGSVYGVYERARLFYESEVSSTYNCAQSDIVRQGSNIGDAKIGSQQSLLALLTFNAVFNGSNSLVQQIWDGCYIGLNRANLIISGIDNLQIDWTPEKTARKNQVLGEAYFFRAFYHYTLVMRWDNIVLADKVSNDPDAKITLVNKDAVLPLIVSDLTNAIELLKSASDIGFSSRISKGTARHLLSKAYLVQNEWAKAAEMAEAVINDGYYKLEPLDNIFSCQFQDNKEIILKWEFLHGDANHQSRTCQMWLPLYDRVNGVKRSFEQGGRPYARMHPSDYFWTLYEKNDLRLNAFNKTHWVYDVETESEGSIPAGEFVGDTVKAETMTEYANIGAIVITPTTKKYFEDGTFGRKIDDASGWKDVIHYRLAESYLIAAEANWRAGNEAKALNFINSIRRRAGVADFTSLDQEKLLAEQARELGHEGHRYDMLKRLGLLVERVKLYNPDAGPNIQDFHVRWPIPRNFVDMTKVSQNEGYSE